jgi:hypothetical protein
MLHDAVAIAAVAALCAGWVLFQRWIARMDPELPGIKRSCSGCAVPGAEACRGRCERLCRSTDGGRALTLSAAGLPGVDSGVDELDVGVVQPGIPSGLCRRRPGYTGRQP